MSTKYHKPYSYGYAYIGEFDSSDRINGGGIVSEPGSTTAYVSSHMTGFTPGGAVLQVHDVHSAYNGDAIITLFDTNHPGQKLGELTFHKNGNWRFDYTPTPSEEYVLFSEEANRHEHLVIAKRNDEGCYDCVVFSDGPLHNRFYSTCACYDSRWSLGECNDLYPLALAKDLFNDGISFVSRYCPARVNCATEWKSGGKTGRIMQNNPAGTHCLYYDVSQRTDSVYQIGSCVDGKSVICASKSFAGIPKIGGSHLSFGVHVDANGAIFVGHASLTGANNSVMPYYTYVTIDKNNFYVHCNNPGYDANKYEMHDTWNTAPHSIRINKKTFDLDVMRKVSGYTSREVVSSFRFDDYFPAYPSATWTAPAKNVSLYCAGKVIDKEPTYTQSAPTYTAQEADYSTPSTPTYKPTSQQNTVKVSTASTTYSAPQKTFSERCADYDKQVAPLMKNFNYNAYVDPNCVYITSVKKPTEEVVVPDCVTELWARAFGQDKCNVIKKIVIPSSVTAVEKNCFVGCTSLTEIEFNASVTEIKEGVFANTALTHIVLPDSVQKIAKRAFENCHHLKAVFAHKDCKASALAFPAGVELVDKADFDKYMATCNAQPVAQYAPTTTQSAPTPTRTPPKPDYTTAAPTATAKPAFQGNIDDQLADFYYIKGSEGYVITKVKNPNYYMEIPEGVVKIDSGAFQDVEELCSIYLPSSLKEIGGKAFFNCENLTSVAIERTQVETIKSRTFYNTAIRSMNMPKTLKKIESNTFSPYSICRLCVPPDCIVHGQGDYDDNVIFRNVK